MGGDSGPDVAIEGAIKAVSGRSDLHVVLVGPEEMLHSRIRLFAKNSTDVLDRISVHPASEVISMHDVPVTLSAKKRMPALLLVLTCLWKVKPMQWFLLATLALPWLQQSKKWEDYPV